MDKSDPYVVLSLGGQKHTSRVVDNNLNPEWGQARAFLVAALLL